MYFFFILFGLFVVAACEGEGESSGGVPNTDGGGGDSVKHKVTFFRPSPCQRIYGPLYINLTVASPEKIKIVYVTLNNATIAVFNKEPFTSTVFQNSFPPDGSYLLKAVAEYKDGKTASDEIEIRLDVQPPYRYNILILDSDANPFGLDGNPGALFRVNPGTGTVCVVASSPNWVSPTSMAVQNDSTVLIADHQADMDGSGSGVGAIFKVYLDRFDAVELYKASGQFRGTTDVKIDPNSGLIHVVDYDADPLGLGGAPGAIFSLSPIDASIVSTFSWPQLVSPVSVMVDETTGDFWVVDSDASPYDPPPQPYRGSVWRYVKSTGDFKLIAASNSFITPYKVLPDGTGKLILVDSGDLPNNVTGRLYLIDPNIADPQMSATELKSGNPFKSPAGFTYHPEENLFLIADRNADTESPKTRGAILYYNPATGALGYYITTNNMFLEPFDVALSKD